MKKLITVLLIFAMLVPMMTFMASAAEIENLYKPEESKVGIPSTSNMNSATDGNANYHGSNIIAVKEGDVVTIGPVLRDQGYYLTAYKADGSGHTAKIAYGQCKEVAVIKNNARIVKWTVPAGVAYIRMANSQMFRDCTVITVNNEYTVDEYFACMAKANIDVGFLKSEGTANPTNIFPVSDNNFWGRTDGNDADVSTGAYVTTPYIEVKEGDVVYFGAAAQDQGYHLTLYDANKKYTTNVKKEYMVLYEDLGRGFGIYAYRMRTGTGYLRIVAAGGVYGDGQQFATLNQPFTGDEYRKMFNIELTDGTPLKESVLNGKTALFMGDSISYGAGDGASYSHPGKAWAGRIEAITGLKATNASVSGSKVSFLDGDDSDKWHFTQFQLNRRKDFDMIVIQGGVNDARHNRAVGDYIDVNSSDSDFQNARNTYIGGLQLLFHNVKKTWPDAKLFFIANHRLNGHNTGNAKDMAPYFDKAKELCELYGFIFIDLYNNTELESKLQSHTTKYLPDTLHINAQGYEIVTPYILEALEAEYAPEVEETSAEETSEEAPPTEDVTTQPAPEETTVETPEKGCGSVINSMAIITIVTLAGAAIARKKRD